MALRAVPDHPKFAELKALLGRPKFAVLGILETVWHFTGRFTPQGNIGKYSDMAIESWAEWDGKSGELIVALVQSRWLDAHDIHRLVVHDWYQHADKAVHAELARRTVPFATGEIPDSGRLNQSDREQFTAWLEAMNIQPKPRGRPAENQLKGSLKSDKLSEASAEKPKPVPVPVPEPVPVPVPEPEAMSENKERSHSRRRKGSPTIHPRAFFDAWNEHRKGLPEVEEFGRSRRQKVQARINQGITLERFQLAVDACTEKPFLRGENDRGWTATFDWLITNDRNIEKAIHEYNSTGNGRRGGFNGKDNSFDDIAEEIIREHRAGTDQAGDLPWSEEGQDAPDGVRETTGSRER